VAHAQGRHLKVILKYYLNNPLSQRVLFDQKCPICYNIHIESKKEFDMARETKAQREARLELEAAQRLEVAKATYVERMMAVLRRATKQNFELEVSETMHFRVTDRDGREDYFYVSPDWDTSADMALEELEQSVEWKEERAAEAERQYNLRKNALAKLTDEERKALSL